MPEYVAEDLTFIAARLKEIEAEKQKAREKTATNDEPKTTTANTPVNDSANDPSYW